MKNKMEEYKAEIYEHVNELMHYRTKGSKNGIRLYQNKDGSLIPAGVLRYRKNKGTYSTKNPDNDHTERYGTITKKTHKSTGQNTNNDQDKLTTQTQQIPKNNKDHTSFARDVSNEGANTARNLKTSVDAIPVKKQKMDLSNMTDAELQNAINRELKERQYNDLFRQPTKIEKGKQTVSNILGVAGPLLAAVGSSLTIALTIRELRYGKKYNKK